MSTEAFTPYQSSRGEVIAHQDDPPAYIARDALGQVIGIPANGVLSPENVEADITNPPQPIATPAEIAAYRWGVENGGVTVTRNGTPHRFDTSRENRATWLALRLEAQANQSITQPWKTLDGQFIQLTGSDIRAICEAVYMHVEVCFSIEQSLLANPPTVADLPNAFAALSP